MSYTENRFLSGTPLHVRISPGATSRVVLLHLLEEMPDKKMVEEIMSSDMLDICFTFHNPVTQKENGAGLIHLPIQLKAGKVQKGEKRHSIVNIREKSIFPQSNSGLYD